MKIKEIMVGDYLKITEPDKFAGFIGSVQNIGGPSKYLTMYLEPYRNADVFIEDVEGIPLTPEILEKSGFVYNAIPFADGWEQFGLTLYRGGNGYRIDCGINVSLIVDFVHQLQHALRLCGIEHEITL